MYDTVVIGSGLSGLICAYILSKEGQKVCLVEQHSKPGGCMQTFKRDDRVFDTGIHYVGGLGEGENLNSYFKYFRIMDKLKLRRLDENAFDKISFSGDTNEYPLAIGYDNFVEQLSVYFPDEREGLKKYVDFLKTAVASFPLYNLSVKNTEVPEDLFYQKNAKEVICSFTNNVRLQNVLAGNCPLYAGVASKTPIHVHALINDNFIKSSWRLVDGGSQIADALVENIKKNGVEIKTGTKITLMAADKRELKYIEAENGEKIYAAKFISTIHPASMLDMLEGDSLNPAYKEKIYSLEDTVGVFGLYLTLKDNSFKYRNSNYYHYNSENVWTADRKGHFNSFMFLTPAISKSEVYADSATALAYMKYSEVEKWKDTRYLKRGSEYEDFKKRRADMLVNNLCEKFPDLSGAIEKVHTSTPLTFRDYVGARNGALYGVLRNSNEPQNSFLSPRTRIKNLYLSGQNIILHGILGVTIGAVLTCGSMLGFDYLIDRIRNEQ
ncbi:MAG TPA: NAD(P)/FAD-dependent oxidoreductase [bacterium]|nr:NAD(P)/FAD-dependent oxidoreductase [bacterium]HPS30220.1 NAD(P)/FAD-dependent oxidoreductase [bacterium]